ncbi:MAG: hypothetical protein JWN73_4817 [Betaproteobacteria bacterium]|nr:hypothetical protein [Betaproteobacteria bacterium]
MATTITLLVMFMIPLAIGFALFYAIRKIRSAGNGGSSMLGNMARRMPSGDALYAMTFPDIAPLFKPEALLEWHAWYMARRQNRQLIRDGRRWHGEIPGFPTAATMGVTAQGKEDNAADLMALQDAAGQTIVEVLIEYKDDSRTLLTNNAGIFTINPADERKVRFKDESQGRSFEWRGQGLWSIKGAGTMEEMMAQGNDVRTAGMGSGAALATGVAAGAVIGIAADRILQEREQAREARRAQRLASTDTSY